MKFSIQVWNMFSFAHKHVPVKKIRSSVKLITTLLKIKLLLTYSKIILTYINSLPPVNVKINK